MAVWIPVTVVPTSLATVAIDTFITDVSSVMTNWPTASVRSTIPAALVLRSAVSALIRHRRYERPHVFESPSEGEPGSEIVVVQQMIRRQPAGDGRHVAHDHLVEKDGSDGRFSRDTEPRERTRDAHRGHRRSAARDRDQRCDRAEEDRQ